METRANYVLIGAFTLAIIVAAFGFVMWFSGPSKTASRRGFDVSFTGSVAGLSRGGAVTFNGLRVGDVTHLGLDPNDPGQVIAHIEIDKRMPVKTDTRARLEFSGLTGVAALALSGGSPNAMNLEANPNESYPMLHADPSQFQNLLETAQRLAEQLSAFSEKANKLIDQNSESLTKTVSNIEDFTGVLSKKSPDVETMISNLSKSSTKLDSALESVSSFLDSTKGDARKTIVDVGDAARSIRKLSDNLDTRVREIGANLARFSGSGLREYEALAVDGRKTLEEINRAVRSISKDPSQVIFGGKSSLPEYKAR
jgi:phospholipid/cholesterol/gamma-HCH transport system substrate-binding protein